MNKEGIFNLVCELVKTNSEPQDSEALIGLSTRLIGSRGI